MQETTWKAELGRVAPRLLRAAFGAAAGTVLGAVVVLGVVEAWLLLRLWGTGAGAAVMGGLAGGVAVVAGFVTAGLTPTRAIGHAGVVAVRELQLARRVVETLAGGVARTRAGEAAVAVGAAVNDGAKAVPLAQAERVLTDQVDEILGARLEGSGLRGWALRAIRDRVVSRVRRVLLADLRDEAATHGGIDLAGLLQRALGRVDDLVADAMDDHLRGLTRKAWVASVVGGVVVVELVRWKAAMG